MQVCKVHPALLARHISTTTHFIEIVALREMSRGPERERMMIFGRGGDDSCLEWSTGFLISYSINAPSFSIGSIPDGFVWTETSLLFLTLLSNDVSERCVGEWRASDLLQQRLCSAVHQSHAFQTAAFVSDLAERNRMIYYVQWSNMNSVYGCYVPSCGCSISCGL